MAWHPDLAPDAAHGPGAIDQKGGALDAHVFAAVHALLHPHAVFLADIRTGVRAEDERQAVLFLEPVVRGDRILGYADNHGTSPAIIREGVTKPAGLGGASRRVVLRV